jgi:threonine/homoserine/homoserine lactone efflux protein
LTDTSSLLLIQIIPLAWAAAVSPTALSLFLVMMSLTDNPRLAGFSFYAGAIAVLLVTVFIGILLGNSLTSTGHSDPATIGAIDIFLGAIIILIGIRNLFSKGRENSGGALIKYLLVDSAASNFTKFKRFFTVGLLTFLINFSTAIFVLAAGRQIGLAKTGLLPDFTAILVLTIITLVVIEVPLLFLLIFPKTARKATEPINRWINKNGNYLIALFLLAIGVLVMYNGGVRLGIF